MTTPARPRDPRGTTSRRAPKAYKARLTVHVPPDLVEEARDCAYWLRLTLAGLVANALRAEIDHLRTVQNKGKPFQKRSGELRTGRPIGRRPTA